MLRADYLNSDGSREAVIEPLTGEPYEAHHMTTAREYARIVAAEDERDVLIWRVASEKGALVIHPDGSASRPPDSNPVSARDDCVKRSGRTCFCAPCRAARKENR